MAKQLEEDRHESNLEFGVEKSEMNWNWKRTVKRETSLEKWSSSRLIVSLWRRGARGSEQKLSRALLLVQPTIDPFPAAFPNEQQ